MAVIDVTDEQVDMIVVSALKDDYKRTAKYTKIDHSDEYIDPDIELLQAIDIVLGYYLSSEDKIKWNKEKESFRNDP